MVGVNAGSGQRAFKSTGDWVWVNVDVEARWEPDVVGDWNHIASLFGPNSVDLVVAHHTIEHVGCGEARPFLVGCLEVLKPGGSLLVCVPDMRALANRFVLREVDDWTFMVNAYGAYMGEEADRHRWGYTYETLEKELMAAGFGKVKAFDYREIPGASIAKDFWILSLEAFK